MKSFRALLFEKDWWPLCGQKASEGALMICWSLHYMVSTGKANSAGTVRTDMKPHYVQDHSPVVADHKQSPEHGTLSNPVQGPHPPAKEGHDVITRCGSAIARCNAGTPSRTEGRAEGPIDYIRAHATQASSHKRKESRGKQHSLCPAQSWRVGSPLVHGERHGSQAEHDADVQRQVSHRAEGVLLPACEPWRWQRRASERAT